MSYKLTLNDLDREAETSVTQQLVDRFTQAIERGELEPGEKLPTTRALAAEAGVNHLTAARVYRRLAEHGYVTATVGRGTFVRSLTPAAVEDVGDDWQIYALPDHPPSYSEQVLADSFRSTQDPDVISLSIGFPSPRVYPVDELAEITARLFGDLGANLLGYTTAEGLFELREQLAIRGRVEGWATDPDELIVTSGAKQAIDLVTRALLQPGDVAVVETPTFAGWLTSLRATGARIIGVRYGADGLDIDALEQVLARHEVKLVALQTQCQNPTGRDLSPERRERLARLARERNFFIIEDGVYSALRFEGEPQQALRKLAPAHAIYISSLSKTLGGGLRLGWIAARGPVLDRLAALKLETDFHSPTLIQHIVADYFATASHEKHVESAIEFYRARRDALLESLERHLAGEYRIAPPVGGHHLWVTLNRRVEERALYTEALRHGVTFTPGIAVSVEPPLETSIRLSYSLLDPPELDEGVKRIARALREVRRRDRRVASMPVS